MCLTQEKKHDIIRKNNAGTVVKGGGEMYCAKCGARLPQGQKNTHLCAQCRAQAQKAMPQEESPKPAGFFTLAAYRLLRSPNRYRCVLLLAAVFSVSLVLGTSLVVALPQMIEEALELCTQTPAPPQTGLAWRDIWAQALLALMCAAAVVVSLWIGFKMLRIIRAFHKRNRTVGQSEAVPSRNKK